MTGDAYRYTLRVEPEGSAFVIARVYGDGHRIVEGLYSTRRDAAAELRLIREAEAV